ncbi:unnamed protein product [Gadus morhua 'NCC']
MDGALQRAYGAVASQRLPYDPNYDPSQAMMAATAGMMAGMPMPGGGGGGADPKRMVDQGFLAFLRGEGLAESTITLLLQQGFDSTGMLGMMEEHDVRSVTPNLGQARVLSRAVMNCKASGGQMAPRPRSNSFSHRDVYLQNQGLTMDSGLMQQQQLQQQQLQQQQQPHAMQAISPRMGEFLGRRPNSAPSQHLLETTTYGSQRPLTNAAYPMSPGPYGNAVSLARPLYNVHTGLSMSAMGQQAPTVPGAPCAPKTFSGSYSPMELMKRAPNMAPLSPNMAAPSPMHSPQLLRKGMTGAPDPTSAPMATGPTMQGQTFNKMMGRRTGPPVIVSTMITTPETRCCPLTMTDGHGNKPPAVSSLSSSTRHSGLVP